MEEPYLLELRNVSKHFPGVKALDTVHLSLRKGMVHALLGENGAGKSTLMKCLLGMYKMDEGEIFIDGQPVESGSIKKMRELGITIVQQELSPVLERSVMENIFLGREPMHFGIFVDHKTMKRDAEALLDHFHMEIDPLVKMVDLTVAKRQMIEILKAVSQGARVVMMDEPTSALTTREVEHLFEIIEDLKKDGVAVIYVTHKMDEVFRIAQDVTVLRDGKWIASHSTTEVNMDELVREMVGREVDKNVMKRSHALGERVLSVTGLSSKNAFCNVSFELQKGEVIGFAGLVGAGRTEVMETLFGLRRASAGKIEVFGKKRSFHNPRQAINAGLAFLTEERRKDGILGVLDVLSNIMVTNYDDPCFRKLHSFVDSKAAVRAADEYMKKLEVKTTGYRQIISDLSGGNQQKVLLARWLISRPSILLLDEPTRGIDVGAKQEIYQIIKELAAEGKSIIVVSSEMQELLKVCDRIIVMHEGSVTGVLSQDEATQEKIMMLAALTANKNKENAEREVAS